MIKLTLSVWTTAQLGGARGLTVDLSRLILHFDQNWSSGYEIALSWAGDRISLDLSSGIGSAKEIGKEQYENRLKQQEQRRIMQMLRPNTERELWPKHLRTFLEQGNEFD